MGMAQKGLIIQTRRRLGSHISLPSLELVFDIWIETLLPLKVTVCVCACLCMLLK